MFNNEDTEMIVANKGKEDQVHDLNEEKPSYPDTHIRFESSPSMELIRTCF